MNDEDGDFYAGLVLALLIMGTISATVAGFIYYGPAGGFGIFAACCLLMAIFAPLLMLFKD